MTRILEGPLDDLLTREWLLTNGTGGYASGTVIGCPTRRYHGLLVVPRRPPLERVVTLAAVLERLVINGRAVELANFEFNHAIHPEGFRWLRDVDYALDPPRPWIQWFYVVDDVQITKQVTLAQGQPLVRIRYDVTAPAGTRIDFGLLPLLSLRDFHGRRRKGATDPFDVRGNGQAVWVADTRDPELSLALFPTADSIPLEYAPHPDWWLNFRYREEAARGMDCGDDLFTPGWFNGQGRDSFTVEIAGVAGAESIAHARSQLAARSAVARHKPAYLRSVPETPITVLRRAAGQFVVRRRRCDGRDTATILAGYPWFGDWGRDALIALPGLLLATGRHADAREVLLTFASAEQDGLIPNRFSDYGDGCDYNSVDASLWFIHAADAYTNATDDFETWRQALCPVAENIIERFLQGTRYGIHVGSDRLLRCGDASTQLTWMDAKCGETVFTPRHGMPVEINALWYHDLRLLAERMVLTDPARAEHYHTLADAAAASFGETFWNPAAQSLFDCVRDNERDVRIRPNQIFAVSLEHSPLNPDQQRAVVECVTRNLLTPYGLRTLSPSDPEYRGRYEGDGFSRDGAYHQGTVWPWLLGPYIEACLRVNDFSTVSREQGRRCLQPLLDHLGREAGLGSISEIFDGDPPHTPRGCIAQAWSVAEILRAQTLVESEAPVAGAMAKRSASIPR